MYFFNPFSNNAYALLAQVLARNFTEDGNFENWAQKNVADVLNLINTGNLHYFTYRYCLLLLQALMNFILYIFSFCVDGQNPR